MKTKAQIQKAVRAALAEDRLIAQHPGQRLDYFNTKTGCACAIGAAYSPDDAQALNRKARGCAMYSIEGLNAHLPIELKIRDKDLEWASKLQSAHDNWWDDSNIADRAYFEKVLNS